MSQELAILRRQLQILEQQVKDLQKTVKELEELRDNAVFMTDLEANL